MQARQTNVSALFERDLYNAGGILAQPLWYYRPHSLSQRRASSLPSVIGPRHTPQGTLLRLGGLFNIAVTIVEFVVAFCCRCRHRVYVFVVDA